MHSFNRFLPPCYRLAVALLISLWTLNSASAQNSVATDPVGFTTTTLLGNSDTFVSIPFTRPPEFIGATSSAISSGSTITLVGNPLIQGQFVYGGTQHNHYYALIGPISGAGTKEGHTYPMTDNGTGTLTLDTSHDNLNMPANTQVEVIPYWTPATIFPASDVNVSFTPTNSPPTYQTLLRVPNYSALSAVSYATEYYFNNGAWLRVINGNPDGSDGSDDPLLPDGYFVVRNNNGAPTLPLTNIGSVLLKKLAVPLTAVSNQSQDNPVSIVRPIDVALNATGLNPADSSFGAGDQLLLFDNKQVALNKSPSAIYTYDTRWRLSTDATSSDRGADIIPAGAGFIVRKVANGLSAFWTNALPLSAISVVSRKVHGNGVGARDINLPLSGTPAVECRTGGVSQVVFTFPAPVTVNTGAGTQGAQVTSGAGSVSSVSVSGTTVTVNLTGVTNAQWITVTLFGVNDGVNTNDAAVRIGALLGDTTGDRSVNSADISQTKSQSGHGVSSTNFREDVTADGSLNSADISLVKSRSGSALPPP